MTSYKCTLWFVLLLATCHLPPCHLTDTWHLTLDTWHLTDTWLTLATCHFATMPRCHVATLPRCHVATLPRCHVATCLTLAWHLTDTCHVATLQPCHLATLPPCHLATLPRCHVATLPRCHNSVSWSYWIRIRWPPKHLHSALAYLSFDSWIFRIFRH